MSTQARCVRSDFSSCTKSIATMYFFGRIPLLNAKNSKLVLGHYSRNHSLPSKRTFGTYVMKVFARQTSRCSRWKKIHVSDLIFSFCRKEGFEFEHILQVGNNWKVHKTNKVRIVCDKPKNI